jgi:hypothetical protein
MDLDAYTFMEPLLSWHWSDGDIWWMVMVDGFLTVLGATFMPFDLWIMLETLRGG